MSKVWVRLLTAMAVAFTMWASPAMAQATRTWVSGVGDDANPCSRTAPCKTFAGAISKTAAAGEINCLDSGGFGAVTITKSITIRCIGVIGGVLNANTNGVIINAGAADKVVLDGLDFEGVGLGQNGVRILAGRDVVVRNCTIKGNLGASPNGAGILIATGAQTRVTVERCAFIGNVIGISVKPTAGTASAKIIDSSFSANSTAAIQVTGANASASISGVVIFGSPKSLDIVGGASVSSYGNNVLGGTATDAPTLVPLG